MIYKKKYQNISIYNLFKTHKFNKLYSCLIKMMNILYVILPVIKKEILDQHYYYNYLYSLLIDFV